MDKNKNQKNNISAEVEEAWGCVKAWAEHYRDTYDERGEDGLCVWGKKDEAALSTLRAALTEARQPKVVSRESGHVSPTGGKQQESEMTAEEPK